MGLISFIENKTSDGTKAVVTPSHFVNIFWFILLGCCWGAYDVLYNPILLIVPGAIVIYKVLKVELWQFRFDDAKDYLSERWGVFYMRKVHVRYWRIKSVQVVRPFWMLILGLAIVEIKTSEPYRPVVKIYGVDSVVARELCDAILETAEYYRNQKGVKESDFHHF